MKILLVGASGYLAGFVVDTLLALQHDVHSIHRSKPADARGAKVEICGDETDIRELIRRINPDVVINMANFFSRDQDPSVIAEYSRVNALLVTEIGFGCVESGSALLHVGSAFQGSLDNNDPSFGNPYALYRGIAAAIVRWFSASYHLPSIMLNLFDTYGPGDSRGKVIQFLLEQVGSEKPLEMSGGEQILELVHASDVASAIVMAAELLHNRRDQDNSTTFPDEYWCYPQSATTLRNLVTVINRYSGIPLNIEWGARPYRTGEQFERDLFGKPTVPGWTAKVNLDEGLSALFH